MKEKKSIAVAFYDYIGLAQELNDFRNDANSKIDNYLNTKDKDRVTNRWKFNSLQAIHEVQVGIERGMVANPVQLADTEMHIHSMHEPPFPEDGEKMRIYKDVRKMGSVYHPGRAAWVKAFPEKAAALEAALVKHRVTSAERIVRSGAQSRALWKSKYATLLDSAAIKQFETGFASASNAAIALAVKRADDHLAWVVHDLFVGAFEFYDKNDVINGHHFEGQAALCTLGMAGTKKGGEQIDRWLAMPIADKKNIYMQGTFLNQQSIVDVADKVLADAAAIAKKAEKVSQIDSKLMYKALKGMIDFFKNADSAWDEYLRNQPKAPAAVPGGKAWVPFGHKWEGASLFKVSELNRSFFRKGISRTEMHLVGKFAGLAFARMGELTERLRFAEMMYGIDPQTPHPDSPQKPARAATSVATKTTNVPARPGANAADAVDSGRLAAQKIDPSMRAVMTDAEAQHQLRVNGVRYDVDKYMKDKLTNNYHQMRLGAVLGVMETIALFAKLWGMRDGKVDQIQIVEASASLMSIISTGYNFAYIGAKIVRETTDDLTLKGAADITRGGFKLWAGAFAAAAGGLSLWADYMKFQREEQNDNRDDEKFILIARMTVNTINLGLGITAAFSYSGPLLRRIEIELAERAIGRRIAVSGLAATAEVLAARVFLLRLVTWGSLAGWGLTLGEIAYRVYLSCQPNNLEVWCRRCVFRAKSGNGNPYSSAEMEIAEHAEARVLVGV